MCSDVNLKYDKDLSIKLLNHEINLLKNLEDINEIKKAFKNITKQLNNIVNSKYVIDKLKSKTIYQENYYSRDRAKENILHAKENVIDYLEEILNDINNMSNNLTCAKGDFSQENALIIVKKILNNFYSHIEVMYESDVHGKAGITKNDLNKIQIVNEYDVQRILYSLIKPMFPEARIEVPEDAGCLSVRYDIFIENFSIIIEVKCSRKTMTERSLIGEISCDIVNYNHSNIFFFIYDKEKIIKNTTAFKDTYNKSFGEKTVETIIIQPIHL